MRVLIADDNELVRVHLSELLEASGYEVSIARDGREALRILQRTRINLIVSDWEMPDVDGLELCRAVRSWSGYGYVYFILLTNRVESTHVVEGLAAGADDFIRKPFDRSELLMRVRTGERLLELESRHLTVFALAKLAESRDPETGAHLERVRNYSRILGERLRDDPALRDTIDAAYVELLYLTSPLHDIGKVVIPDRILLKPGRLTDDEFAVMRTHTTLGARTLDEALQEHPGADFLMMARDIAATHHERFDGTGYPAGLSGEAIPVCGRIVAVADVYDALTSKRVYKDAYPHGAAREILTKESGRHFDPRVIGAFLAEEAAIVSIQLAHQDRVDPTVLA